MGSASDTDALRKAICSAFPAKVFTGSVTPADGTDWDEAIDDDLDLWQSLKGKTWTAIPADFVDRHAYNLPLLTPEAFGAFLPAWLLRSLSQFPQENVIRDHIVFTLSGLPDSDPQWREILNQRWENRIQKFTKEQIEVLRQFLLIVRNTDPSPIIQEHANSALERLTLQPPTERQ